MTGVLKEWYCNLSPVRQDELHRLESTDIVVAISVEVMSCPRLYDQVLAL